MSLFRKQVAEKKLKLGIVTWNVGNEEPFYDEHRAGLEALFPPGFDMFVVGVQECQYKVGERKGAEDAEIDEEAEMSDDETTEKPLTTPRQQVERVLEEETKRKKSSAEAKFDAVVSSRAKENGMKLLKAVSMLQIRLLVFVTDEIAHMIHKKDIRVGREATGLLGVYANKGGVAVSVDVLGTTLLFINTHLAAHLHHLDDRNKDVSEILTGIRRAGKINKKTKLSQADITSRSHHTFFFGDMNYRVDLNYNKDNIQPEKLKPGSEKHTRNFEQITGQIYGGDGGGVVGDFGGLLAFDQLRNERENGRVLVDFKEAEIKFQPTFKVRRWREMKEEEREKLTVYKNQRMPSWCDRVLFKSLPGCAGDITNVAYTHVPEVTTSDHKPVFAAFDVVARCQPKTSSQAGCQIVVSAVGFSGVGLEGRQGFYPVFGSFPFNLIRPFVMAAASKAEFDRETIHHVKVAHSEDVGKVHLVVSLNDDLVGKDELLGVGVVALGELTAGEVKEVRVPMVAVGLDAKIEMVMKIKLVMKGEDGFDSKESTPEKLSLRQRI